MNPRPGPKERLFQWVNGLPVIGEVADPIVASVLGMLVVVTMVAIAIPGSVFPHDHDARTHVLQIAGGLLVVLGVYYTSIALRDRRAHEYLERFATAIGQLDSGCKATRLGAVRLIQGVALEKPVLPSDSTTAGALAARRKAIWDVLDQLSVDPDLDTATLATHVREELVHSGFARPDRS
jgi:hypothetical protein